MTCIAGDNVNIVKCNQSESRIYSYQSSTDKKNVRYRTGRCEIIGRNTL